jgi:hypothetical protein
MDPPVSRLDDLGKLTDQDSRCATIRASPMSADKPVCSITSRRQAAARRLEPGITRLAKRAGRVV